MDMGLVYNLKLEKNHLKKIQANMETLTNKPEFSNVPDEEYDLFYLHLDAVNNLLSVLDKRIEHYENLKE